VDLAEVTARSLAQAKGDLTMAYIDPAGNAFNDVSSEAEIYLNDGNDSIDALFGGETFVYGGNGNDGLYYDGLAFAHLYGGHGNDQLGGGANGDFLYGEEGVDFIQAASGNDLVDGGAGNDWLLGGAGRDTLIGGLGADSFAFNAATESLRGASRDMIRDFTHREADLIDLSQLDADPATVAIEHFKFIGTQSFSEFHRKHPGSDAVLLRFDERHHLLQGDTHQNYRTDAQDFEVKLVGVSHLANADLILA
jgi:Ca2+-binding RTX toxin-like protein